MEDQERIKILNWLSNAHFQQQQQDYVRLLAKGTGQEFLTSQACQAWVTCEEATLFCTGMPGAGKTMLTCAMIQYLRDAFESSNRVAVCFLFCNYKRHDEQDYDFFVASILEQIAWSASELPQALEDLYNKHQKTRSKPTAEECLTVSLDILKSHFDTVYLLVDALDECSNVTRMHLLDWIMRLQDQFAVQIFATSRPLPDIIDNFDVESTISIRATDDDLKLYLREQMEKVPGAHGKQKKTIIAKISELADGMFLLAKLYMSTLEGMHKAGQIDATIKRWESRREDRKVDVLELAYKDAIDRIEQQNEHAVELAKQIIMWISYATRPLSVEELQQAIAADDFVQEDEDFCHNSFADTSVEDVDQISSNWSSPTSSIASIHHLRREDRQESVHSASDDSTYVAESAEWTSHSDADEGSRDCSSRGSSRTDLDLEQNVVGINQILAVCAGLVTLDEGTRAIRFIHYTTQEHIERVRTTWLPEGHLRMTKGCICYLLRADLKTLRGTKYWKSSQGQHAFLDYAARYWAVHAKKVDEHNQSWVAPAIAFLQMPLRVHLTSKALCDPDRSPDFPWANEYHKVKGIHLAAKFDSIVCMEQLLEQDRSLLNASDDHGRTVLSWAAGSGSAGAVKMLLHYEELDINKGDDKGFAPLTYACEAGHTSSTKLLLEQQGINVNCEDFNGETPLHKAAWRNRKDIVPLLLKRQDIDINHADDDGYTTLIWAARAGSAEIVRSLLDREEIQPDICTSFTGNAVWHAASLEVLLMLLERHISPNVLGHGVSPLCVAARSGDSDTIKVLLAQTNIDVNAGELSYPLIDAIDYGNKDIVALLLQHKDIDVNLQDEFGHTALSCALRDDCVDVVNLLLDRPDLKVCPKQGAELLLPLAAEKGHVAIVERIISQGDIHLDAQLDEARWDAKTALELAITKHHRRVAGLLQKEMLKRRNSAKAT